MKEIYLAGGCFWGMEAYFKNITGVTHTKVGYANGHIQSPTYEMVCNGNTGFAETIYITYNADIVSLAFLLEMYFKVIDPTLINRQGNDIGSQYRTGVYYIDEEDKIIIQQQLKALQLAYVDKVVVECLPLLNFYPAEDYHQQYLTNNPSGYCHISPKKIEEAKKAKEVRYIKPTQEALKLALSNLEYAVTQENQTEPPFQNKYWDTFEKGIYVDITTGEPLFISSDKFDAGCGWPSFSKPIQRQLIKELRDTSLGIERTEVRSKTGDAHLGHVFTDGPLDKGGLRYCINSASLRFIPESEMIEEGYNDYLQYL